MTFSATEIKNLMVALASVCDHAIKKDHMGFSKATALSGHYIALMNSDDYADKHILLGSSIAKVHMRQLGLSESLFDETIPTIKEINSFVHVPHIYCENGAWEMYCTKSDSLAYKLAKCISMNARDDLIREIDVAHGFRFNFLDMDTAFKFAYMVANSHSDKTLPFYKIEESEKGEQLVFRQYLSRSGFTVNKGENEILFQAHSKHAHEWIRFTCDSSKIDLKRYLDTIDNNEHSLRSYHKLKLLDAPKVKQVILESRTSIDELYKNFESMKYASENDLEMHSYFTNYKARTVFFFPYQTSDEIFAGIQFLRDDIEPFLKNYCKTPGREKSLLTKLKIDKTVTKTLSFAKTSCSPALLLAIVDYLESNQVSHNITKFELDKLKIINNHIEHLLLEEYKSKRTVVIKDRTLILPSPELDKFDSILNKFSFYIFKYYKGIPAAFVRLDPRFYYNDAATLNDLMERYHFYFENDDSDRFDCLLKEIGAEAKDNDHPLPNGFIEQSKVSATQLIAKFSFSYTSLGQVKKFPADTRRFHGSSWIIDTSLKPKECLSVLYRLKELNWYIEDKVFVKLKQRIQDVSPC